MVPLDAKRILPILVTLALLLAGCARPDAEPTPDATPSSPSGQAPTSGTPPAGTPPTPRTPAAALPDPSEWPEGDPMRNVRFLSSQGGVLNLTLAELPASLTLDNQTYNTTLYNDTLVPAVWRLQRNDTIRLTLEDRRNVTPPDSASLHAGHGAGTGSGAGSVGRSGTGGAGGDAGRVPGSGTGGGRLGGRLGASAGDDPHDDYTNVHFHGLNVPPAEPGDNVFVKLHPRGYELGNWSYNYTVQIPPDHPAGVFWFHPHPHGVSSGQVLGGMSGAMIIGDLAGEQYPDVRYSKERIFLLRDFQQPGALGAVKLLNGLSWSSFSLAPNETQLWRLANVGADRHFHMALVDENGTRVPFYVIALDGNAMAAPQERDSLFLHPGARMDAFVVGPRAGNYTLKSLAVKRNVFDDNPQNLSNVEDEVSLAAVTSNGTGLPDGRAVVEQIKASRARHPDARFANLTAWARANGTNVTREIAFTVDNKSSGNANLGINHVPYNESVDMVNVTFGAVEVWNVSNPTDALHVFHIHQMDFLVWDNNGTVGASTGLQDTVLLPVQGYVRLVIPFTEEHTIGRYVFHCHILSHEDKGMMANIVVWRPDPPAG